MPKLETVKVEYEKEEEKESIEEAREKMSPEVREKFDAYLEAYKAYLDELV